MGFCGFYKSLEKKITLYKNKINHRKLNGMKALVRMIKVDGKFYKNLMINLIYKILIV